MGDRVIELFEEYVASVARGEQPDAVEYVARAGDERDKLEALIDEFLAEAAPREPSDEAVTMMRAWIEQEPPLLELRTRRRLRRADVVRALVERLGLDPRKRAKIEDYYHELEVGQLDATRVDERVFVVLGDVFGVRSQEIQGWPRRPAGVDVQVAYRSPPGESPAAMPTGPRAEAADRDEVDELFLGSGGH